MDIQVKEQIAKAWSKGPEAVSRTRFWESPHILRHVNKLVCGEEKEGWNGGALALLPKFWKEKTGQDLPLFKKALSIGAGAGWKEIAFLEAGIVDTFYAYEFSPVFIEKGKTKAKEKALEERLIYSDKDFFSTENWAENTFDLVFWDNSLHHMFDVYHALEVTKKVLKKGGLLFCNDFAGASRFQWSEAELNIVNSIRNQLFDLNPNFYRVPNTNAWYPVSIERPSMESMIASDPSEAADSANILSALEQFFPDAFVKQIGGLIYHLGLNDILTHIPEDSSLLNRLLELDTECIGKGFIHYFFALAINNKD